MIRAQRDCMLAKDGLAIAQHVRHWPQRAGEKEARRLRALKASSRALPSERCLVLAGFAAVATLGRGLRPAGLRRGLRAKDPENDVLVIGAGVAGLTCASLGSSC